MQQDSLGQTYWQLCRAVDFTPLTSDIFWDSTRHTLRLAQSPGEMPRRVARSTSQAAANGPALALDPYGGWARVVPRSTGDEIHAGGVAEPEVTIFTATVDNGIVDIAATTRDWLVILLEDGTAQVRDLIGRFDPREVQETGFFPDRIVETTDQRLFLLERSSGRFRRVLGNPLPEKVRHRARADYVFRPQPLDPDPPRLAPAPELSVGGDILDAAPLPDGRIGVLALDSNRDNVLHVTNGNDPATAIPLPGLSSGFSIRADGKGRLHVLVPEATAAITFNLTGEDDVNYHAPSPILRDYVSGRLCVTLPDQDTSFPVPPYVPVTGGPPRPFRRLIAPSRPQYAYAGQARGMMLKADVDSAIWHKIYVEADLPMACGITIWLAADDDPEALADLSLSAMHPHAFGQHKTPPPGPRGIWLDQDSERPHLRSATDGARKRDKCGLFEVLIQKAAGSNRRLEGRFLRIEITLSGNGRATPALFALRVWGSRTPWRDRYLPAHMTTATGPQAEGSDFLDRFLCLFEGVLTPLEEEVAHAYRLTRPDTSPTHALDWVASWIGADIDSGLPEATRRRLLSQSVQLWRQRGTLLGLWKVLEIITDGGMSRGDIVLLEHHHLRRTFATILGIPLSDETPLTPWARRSGNSFLGSTFFLGDAERKNFFALFRPELLDDPLTTEEERAAAFDQLGDFFDDHAFRLSVIIHTDIDPEMRALIGRVLQREVPAHVIATMLDAPGSLVLALSSIVSIDTRLGPARPIDSLRIGEAQIGQVALSDLGSLDPRSKLGGP